MYIYNIYIYIYIYTRTQSHTRTRTHTHNLVACLTLSFYVYHFYVKIILFYILINVSLHACMRACMHACVCIYTFSIDMASTLSKIPPSFLICSQYIIFYSKHFLKQLFNFDIKKTAVYSSGGFI